MISHESKQESFVSDILEKHTSKDHAYRKIKRLINFEKLLNGMEELYSKAGTKGEPIERGFKCLLIQYWEDFSDRQMERYVQENIPMRWFCGYELSERTPDHSYFGKLRKRIGVEKLSELFNEVVSQLEKYGYVGNVFHFVDASSLMSKVNLWEARDKALKDKENDQLDEEGHKKLNNKNMDKYSSDPDARFGCKGNKNFWFGYKRHVRVDMKHGLITKAALTSAEVGDHNAFLEEELCPDQGMLFLDKGYDADAVSSHIKERGCASAGIKKNNRPDKNKDLDRWRTSVRMPYENVFRFQSKWTRYRKKKSVHFQVLMEAFAYNLKRLISIDAQQTITAIC